MSDDKRSADDIDRRYHNALHSIQSALAAGLAQQELKGTLLSMCSPKHMRVGVNSAMCESAALVELLVEKGIIDLQEYRTKLVEMLEREAETVAAAVRKETGLPDTVRFR